jgi:exopolyphosphatase / guanosine-5'-triphosphate,3'-diphosphate pyrophosphatase
MNAVRRAVIDVGTNSIKLLLADVAAEQVLPVLEESRQTRLGRGFYQTRRLQPEAVARTAEAVSEFAGKARELQARTIRVIGTSAAREALNANDLVAAIQRASGLALEVISGEQEADWVFQGVATDARLAGQPLLLLDVGGGSSEFILGQDRQKHFRHSFPLGTVRLLEELPHSDPPKPVELAQCRAWLKQFLKREVRPKLVPELQGEVARQLADKSGHGSRGTSAAAASGSEWSERVQLVGTGGTASILGCLEARLDRFDRQQLEATTLSLERLRWHTEHLWSLDLEQRKLVVGLPKNRADVILTGTAIYEAVLSELGFATLQLSTRGLRFAVVLEGGGKG